MIVVITPRAKRTVQLQTEQTVHFSGLISPKVTSLHFLQLVPIAIVQYFTSTIYRSPIGDQVQFGKRSLPGTSTHEQLWELKPRSFDVESKALSIESCAPINKI